MRGRLAIERIAGKDYTTLKSIERMRELCRVESKDHVYISAARETMRAAATPESGSSVTEITSKARAALHTILEAPSEHLPSTSQKSTPKGRVSKGI
jgi:hypothetical protein